MRLGGFLPPVPEWPERERLFGGAAILLAVDIARDRLPELEQLGLSLDELLDELDRLGRDLLPVADAVIVRRGEG